jgi:thiamine biosynthesis lipoprotein
MAVTEHRFRIMASDALIIAVDATGDEINEAQRLLERIEQRWSRFLPDSDVSRINRAGGHPTVVDPLTLTLLATMAEASRLTDGRYDPTVLPILVADGYVASIVTPADRTVLPVTASHLGSVRDVVTSASTSTVTAPVGAALDPGGIGKGLAADLAVSQILHAGAAGALVAIGGDLCCAGAPPQPDGWPITIEDPDDPTADILTFTTTGGGVATSSTRSRRWTHGDTARHHIIDPTTSTMSRTDLAAVTVVARSGWLAEAHATAAILQGSSDVIAYIAANQLSGLAVTDDGRVLATADFSAAGTLPTT